MGTARVDQKRLQIWQLFSGGGLPGRIVHCGENAGQMEGMKKAKVVK